MSKEQIEELYKEQIEELYKDHRYKKECPFCHSICENFIGCNLFCRCNAKYYYNDKVWLDRNTGKEIWDNEQRAD